MQARYVHPEQAKLPAAYVKQGWATNHVFVAMTYPQSERLEGRQPECGLSILIVKF